MLRYVTSFDVFSRGKNKEELYIHVHTSYFRQFVDSLKKLNKLIMFSLLRTRSRIARTGAASKQAGSETLIVGSHK